VDLEEPIQISQEDGGVGVGVGVGEGEDLADAVRVWSCPLSPESRPSQQLHFTT